MSHTQKSSKKWVGISLTVNPPFHVLKQIMPGFRSNCAETSFAAILPEDLEAIVKAAAEISMGTEISDSDIAHIHSLCDQVIAISAYRVQLAEYLRNRMIAIAPNLTALVGELVGARLISHAGSLLSLAKHPASTVQILGAEKALFRALKTKHDTPKYGLIYHVSLFQPFEVESC
jgi:nucleolar protein 58